MQGAITDTTPDQLKLPFALWTRTAAAQLIQRRFGITMPVQTWAIVSSGGDSPCRSRSSGPTNNGPRRFRHGSSTNIPRSRSGRWRKARRCMGR